MGITRRLVLLPLLVFLKETFMDTSYDLARLSTVVHRSLTRWLLIAEGDFLDFIHILYEELEDEYTMNG